jgi:hypothetical protein
MSEPEFAPARLLRRRSSVMSAPMWRTTNHARISLMRHFQQIGPEHFAVPTATPKPVSAAVHQAPVNWLLFCLSCKEANFSR